jgi:hypothetical protein
MFDMTTKNAGRGNVVRDTSRGAYSDIISETITVTNL